MEPNYNVVFEYREQVEGYAGIRTITSFKDKQDFEAKKTPGILKRERIIAEGVSTEEAQRLCDETSVRAIANSILYRSKNKQTGEVDRLRFEMLLANSLFAVPSSKKHELVKALETAVSFSFS